MSEELENQPVILSREDGEESPAYGAGIVLRQGILRFAQDDTCDNAAPRVILSREDGEESPAYGACVVLSAGDPSLRSG